MTENVEIKLEKGVPGGLPAKSPLDGGMLVLLPSTHGLAFMQMEKP